MRQKLDIKKYTLYYKNRDGYLIKTEGMFKNVPRKTQKLLGWKRVYIKEGNQNNV